MNYKEKEDLQCCWNCYWAKKIEGGRALACYILEQKVSPIGICDKFAMKREPEKDFNPFSLGNSINKIDKDDAK